MTTPLAGLPSPDAPVDVAVYSFDDLTGQHKPADNFAQFSRAVTQGGSAVLIDVLKETGGGAWFRVVERVGLQALLQERTIIENARKQFLGPDAESLPPLRLAGVLLQGGIVDYDTNTVTGGAGARYLGIGGDTQYRHDVITVTLRAASVSSGEVLASVSTTKTVYSVLARGQGFKFVAIDELLEIEAGWTRNEPVGLAVRQAIQLAVYSLIMEGVEKGLWRFEDPLMAGEIVDRYRSTFKRIPAKGADSVKNS